jgi:hypothetical protein
MARVLLALPRDGKQPLSLTPEDLGCAVGMKPHIVRGCLGELSWLGLTIQVGKKREPMDNKALWRISSQGKKVVSAIRESFGGQNA